MAQLVIADTGPVNYLILIRHIELLPRLFERVVLPTIVRDELLDAGAPADVRNWAAHLPAWIETHEAPATDASLATLDAGEAAVIALATTLHADLLLIDERKGVNQARRRGFRVTGLLGLLEMAAQAGLVDFGQAVEQLRRTTFRSPEALLDLMLKRNRKERRDV